MDESFEILEHPADLGIRSFGDTLAGAFENAARGLISVILEARSVDERSERTIAVSASDREHLLVRWLSEVLYLYDAERFVPAAIRIVEFSDHNLKAEIPGEDFDEQRHHRKLDVKAITYHQLRIEPVGRRHQVTVFVDI
jgi:SHS2 domain-containing protein